jgi:hypothetical protein
MSTNAFAIVSITLFPQKRFVRRVFEESILLYPFFAPETSIFPQEEGVVCICGGNKKSLPRPASGELIFDKLVKHQ